MFREAVQEAASELGNTFFATMFRPMDALFLLLAVATAWRIASGGN